MKKDTSHPDLYFDINGTYIKCNDLKSLSHSLPTNLEIINSLQRNKGNPSTKDWSLTCLSMNVEKWTLLCKEIKSKQSKFNNSTEELVAYYFLKSRRFPVFKVIKNV